LDEFVQSSNQERASGGKISPIEIPAVVCFAAPL
jgi:hypothetical protein